MKIVTIEEMQELERRSEEAGVSTDALMENAGLAVARKVEEYVGSVTDASVLMLIGPGNNGGDGLVAARHLHSWGARVHVYLCKRNKDPDPKLELAKEQWIEIIDSTEDHGFGLLKGLLASSRVVVDAVLGTGRARPIEGVLKEVFLSLRAARERGGSLLVSLDLPSGLDADTGAVDPLCVEADVTFALASPKSGLFCFPGAEKVGRLEVVDIGIPPGLDERVQLQLMTEEWASKALPERALRAHKGSFGKALVVAGSRNYVGAAYLSCTAATRVGAGLVTLATPQSLQAALAAQMAEVTYIPLPETQPGAVSLEAKDEVLESLPEYDALLVGCGLGQAETTRAFVQEAIMGQANLPPLVLDADALNILSSVPDSLKSMPEMAIVTPHPGEMGRLASRSVGEIEKDRLKSARNAAADWNKIVVLKGAFTVVASPGGYAMVSPFANPGLASAGTGDVLAGSIVGLLAQGLSPMEAACLGVYLHGVAGEAVRNELGDTGMVAGDLLPALPRVIKRLKEHHARAR